MALTYNRTEGSLDLKPEPKKQSKTKLLVIGGVGAGLFWLFTQQEVSYRPTAALSTPETPSAPQAPQAVPAAPPIVIAAPSPVIAPSLPAPARSVATSQAVMQRPVILTTNKSTVQRQIAMLSQLPELPNRVRALDSLIELTRNIQTLTPKQMKVMPRLVTKLRYQGATAVPAIRDFLRTKADFNIDNIQGSELASQRTLRLALIDTLRQIGGEEAITALDEQLKNNKDAAETAALKQSLAQQAQRGTL